MENMQDRACKTLLVLVAIVLLGIGMGVVYLCNPRPTEPSKVELKIEVKDKIESSDLIPPSPKPERGKKKLVVSDDVAAQQVIRAHIDGFLLKSYRFGSMTREEYVTAIAEAVVKHTQKPEDAFWMTGIIQTESSFRLSARPSKSTNSSARGLTQVIMRYHGDVLGPANISREDLCTDIDKSVLGGVLVFNKYLRPRRGGERTRKEALRRYRSLSASETEQLAYYKSVNSVFLKLKEDFRKEVKAQ